MQAIHHALITAGGEQRLISQRTILFTCAKAFQVMNITKNTGDLCAGPGVARDKYPLMAKV